MNYSVLDTKKYYPLSFAQRRLWFLEQFDPGNIAYNVSSLYSLKGTLDRSNLERSLQEVFLRHEILRTTFLDTDDGPKQCVKYEPNFPLRFVDFTDNPSQDAPNAIQEEIIKVTREPYNLRAGPLIRVTLFKQSEGEHVLHIAMHHIVTDGWSSRVLIKELSELYSAYCQGSQSPLQPLPIQYGDFAVSQREQLTGAALSQQLDYWKNKLIDAQPLDLPTDYQRPARQTFEGSNVDWVFPEDLIQNLKALANNQRVTLFMILLAALKILVARYSQQQDVVIGIPIANRTRSELENLIGFFVNTLALRTNLADDPTLENLIHEIREETLQAYSHQDLPFEKLVEETHPERDLSRNPIYQVFFAFQNLPQLREEFADLSIERLPQKRTTVMTDLDIYAWEESGCLQGTFVYNKALFEPLTIKRMIGHYRTILEEIVADPSRRISQIQILTEKEQTQLLSDWNSTSMPFPEDSTIGKLFEDQANKTPDTVALEFGDQTLSFLELNARANQLARYLRKSGVVAESPVGVYMDRSMEQVIAILGVIKAGGAYVPLDPDYPGGRIQFMLQDSGCQVLVTQSDLRTVCSEYGGKVVTIDEDWPDIEAQSSDNPDSITTPETAAYIIYTSGSTGTPNGVMGLHRGAVNRMNWMWRNYPFIEGEVCCLKTRISFVDSVWELFGPLLQGVRVVLIPDEVVQDPERLVKILSSSRVSRLVLVPSLLRVLLQNVIDLRTRLPNLTLWITSGESLTIELFQQFRKILPQSRLLNLYGSSEVSADVTASELTLDENRDQVSIGKPIDNTKTYILDQHMNPVPIGVPGELYVGGVGLARGYSDQPELTSKRFVRNPFDSESEPRLFKTGDLARYWNNGEIEYMGRGDSQIKLRGFRIELGEIEATLEEVKGIQSAVVAVNEGANEQLIAFYIPQGDCDFTLSQDEIRDHATALLPKYMVPVVYQKLEKFPLTASGKIDRIALLANENLKIKTTSSELREPQNDVELRLLELWRHVLQTELLSTDDNFFDLGGHSLLAVELISKVNQVFEKTLPVVALFESPTIEELARIIGAVEDPTVQKSLFCVRSGNDKQTPFYFVHDVDGEAILYHGLANSISPDRPVYVLRPYGTAECPILHSRIKDMAAHYIDEIKQIQPNGPYHVGGLCAGGVIAFEMACQLQDGGDEVPMVAILDALEITTKPSRSIWDRRFGRASTVIHGKGQRKGLLDKNVVPTLLGKIKNTLIYEISTRSKNIYDLVRVNYYKRYVDAERALPQILKSIPVATVYRIARKKYSPGTFQGQLVLFRATEATKDKNVPFDDTPVREITSDPTFGWNKRATRGVHVEDIPGGHSTMLHRPNVTVLGKKIEELLQS